MNRTEGQLDRLREAIAEVQSDTSDDNCRALAGRLIATIEQETKTMTKLETLLGDLDAIITDAANVEHPLGRDDSHEGQSCAICACHEAPLGYVDITLLIDGELSTLDGGPVRVCYQCEREAKEMSDAYQPPTLAQVVGELEAVGQLLSRVDDSAAPYWVQDDMAHLRLKLGQAIDHARKACPTIAREAQT